MLQWRLIAVCPVVPPIHGAIIPRCVSLSVPLLQTEITAAPPSSKTRLSYPVLGLQAVCCRWLLVFIFRLTVTSEDRTSFCRTTKEKGAPQRCSVPCSRSNMGFLMKCFFNEWWIFYFSKSINTTVQKYCVTSKSPAFKML